MQTHQAGMGDMQWQILAVQEEVPHLRSRLQASEEAMGLIQDINRTVGLKLDNMWGGLSHVQTGFRNLQSQVEGECQNLKSEGERERLVVKNNMEEHIRMINSQFRVIVPQFVRQVKKIMGPRDSQIVALDKPVKP